MIDRRDFFRAVLGAGACAAAAAAIPANFLLFGDGATGIMPGALFAHPDVAVLTWTDKGWHLSDGSQLIKYIGPDHDVRQVFVGPCLIGEDLFRGDLPITIVGSQVKGFETASCDISGYPARLDAAA